MSKNHSTEERVCAVDTLHARVFGVRRAAANEGIFIPHLVLYVLRSNCPTLPVKLDYPFAHRRAVARSRHFRRITVRLFDFSRRLGDTRDQCYYPRPSLDDLLQTPGTRQRPDATTGKSLVRGGQRCIANGDSQSGYRRHVDSTPIREGAGQYHSARPCQKAQPAAVSAGAMLGYVGLQRAGQCGQEVCVTDCVPFCPGHRQSQQADHSAGVGAQPGARDNEQACSATVRCLVHASTPGIATAVAKDTDHRSSTVRYRIIPAIRQCVQAWTRTTQNLRDQNDARGNPEFAGNRSQADTLWQGAVGSSAHRGGNGAFSQKDAGARGMVRILRCKFRTMQVNQLRGLFYEFGVTLKDDRQAGLTEIQQRMAEREEIVPGVLFEADSFKSGREFAAFVGLVPRQSATGGKIKLLGISKRGARIYAPC